MEVSPDSDTFCCQCRLESIGSVREALGTAFHVCQEGQSAVLVDLYLRQYSAFGEYLTENINEGYDWF